MDVNQATASTIPHIIQVYQSTISDAKLQAPQVIHLSHPLSSTHEKPTYEQVNTIPLVSQHVEINQHVHMSQNHIVMSCEQTIHNLQPVQTHIQPQGLQATELTPLQITSHMILPSVFKQHMIVNEVQQYYGQFEYQKECFQTKIEPQIHIEEITNNEPTKDEKAPVLAEFSKAKKRSKIPNPNKWVCNLRKIKHQRGEAYISRRGQYVPEKKVQNIKDCSSCMHKCSKRISESDREHIFKAFWSLSSNEKKHFLLNTTERFQVYQRRGKNGDDSNLKKKYTFKYFFLVRGVRYVVCKKFYLGTLSISQKPVYNVHLGKSDVNIPKPDGRGLSGASSHALPYELIERVKNHILSFMTIDSKPVKLNSKKKQYLDPNLSIKNMYTLYVNECNEHNVVPVKEHMYRKIFKQDFNLHFKKNQAVCCKCKGPVKKEKDM